MYPAHWDEDKADCFLYWNGLPRWCSDKEDVCQCKRHGFDPWVGKIPLDNMINPFLPKAEDVFAIVKFDFYQHWGREREMKCKYVFSELKYQCIYKNNSSLIVMVTVWFIFNGFNHKIALRLIHCFYMKKKKKMNHNIQKQNSHKV